MKQPVGSLRERGGYDRVLFEEGSLDLQVGQGRLVANALEDGVFKGIWCVSIYGAPAFVVLARVDGVIEWRPESMAVYNADDDLYTEQEQEDELLGGGQ